jgi:tRNA threonylcarbamoyladenosine biosynthesis protein TsaB
MLIAIDTSSAYTGLACYDTSGILAECVWRSGRDHTTQLLPQADLLLRQIGRTPADLTGVGVALGPGSWSGLRVGVSTAKGLALARSLPLIGIATPDLLAYQHRKPRLPIYPLLRLGRDRFATALFADREPWARVGDYRNVTLAELCADIDRPVLFCGDIDDETQAQLRQLLGAAARFPTSPAANLRRPGYLAECAWTRLQAGQTDNLATLEPIYLGHPVQPRQVGSP